MYSTQTDIENRLTLDELKLLAGDPVETAKITKAITDADALINSYMGKLYQVPVSPVPAVVANVSAEEAIYNLYGLRRRVPEYWENRHKDNLSWLAKVAKGQVSLGIEPVPASGAGGKPEFSSEDKIFDRESMKDY